MFSLPALPPFLHPIQMPIPPHRLILKSSEYSFQILFGWIFSSCIAWCLEASFPHSSCNAHPESYLHMYINTHVPLARTHTFVNIALQKNLTIYCTFCPVSYAGFCASGPQPEVGKPTQAGDLRGKDAGTYFAGLSLQPIFLAWLNLHFTKGKI